MAKFQMQLPTEIIKDLQRLANGTDEIVGEMTRAGAQVVYDRLQSCVPASFKSSGIMDCIKITRTYKTPSDGGINTKVGFYGYFTNEDGRRTPAPLVANVFEYGSTKFQKHPFFRKAFNKKAIEQAMLEAQKKASGGLLDE